MFKQRPKGMDRLGHANAYTNTALAFRSKCQYSKNRMVGMFKQA